jgi:hypothetical protein
MTCTLVIDGNRCDETACDTAQRRAELSLRPDAEVVFEVSVRREIDVAIGLPLARDAGVVDVSRTIPNRLPEALRAASKQALEHAADPLNRLDYNPFIVEGWTIVAAEFQSLAAKLERRFHALFDGRDAYRGLTYPQSDDRGSVLEAARRHSRSPVDGAIHHFSACLPAFLPAEENAERRTGNAVISVAAGTSTGA